MSVTNAKDLATELLSCAFDLVDEFELYTQTLDCGDSSCFFTKVKTGMRTNGGCRCLDGKNGAKVVRALKKYRQAQQNFMEIK